MTTWGVSLLVGLGAGVLGTFVRVVHERGAELRSRMLSAADDFVYAVDSTQTVLWATLDAEGELQQARAPLPRMLGAERPAVTREERERSRRAEQAEREAVEEAASALAVADRSLPRIRLLFGVDSAATQHAKQACDELRGALQSIETCGHLDPLDPDSLRPEDAQRGGSQLDDLAERHVFLHERIHSEIWAARDALDDFSRAARTAISGVSLRGLRST